MSKTIKQNLEDIPFSVLDLAPVVAGSTPREAFANMLALSRHAERLGYHRYWLAEHHNMAGVASSATAVLIGQVAAHTRTIRVGSGGVMLPNHAPLVIAEQFGTLESMFPGRIDLGLGRAPGTDPLTARALRRDLKTTAHDFPELVEEIQSYFAPAKPEQHVLAQPGTGLEVPIWILGSSTHSALMAARSGLPYAFASHFAPDELMDALYLYRKNFQPSEKLKAPYVMVGVPLITGRSEDEARYLFTSTQQKYLNLVRGGSRQMQAPVENIDDVWTSFEANAVSQRLAVAIVGGAKTIREKLQDFLRKTEADEFIFVSDYFTFDDRLRSFEILASIKGSKSAAGNVQPAVFNKVLPP